MTARLIAPRTTVGNGRQGARHNLADRFADPDACEVGPHLTIPPEEDRQMIRSDWIAALVTIFLLPAPASASPGGEPSSPDRNSTLERMVELGVPGGLCLQIGLNAETSQTNSPTKLAEELVQSGRFLVHVTDESSDRVKSLERRGQSKGLYGLLSVERRTSDRELPFSENLVNLVILHSPSNARLLAEIERVLCPGGVILIAPDQGLRDQLFANGFQEVRTLHWDIPWLAARKGPSKDMDEWSHPRHAADGNAVSNDMLAGPPRRIRWLAGPWQEVPNLVTGGGRNYYGGVLARDGYNGLRLWQRSLSPSKSGFSFRPAPGSVPPIADDQRVYVFSAGTLQALDGRTGRLVKQYAVKVKPNQVLEHDGLLVVVSAQQVDCLDATSARPLWSHQGSLPRHVVAGDNLVALVEGDARKGETCEVAVLDIRTGQPTWQRGDIPWAAKATRSVYHRGLLAFEVSSMNNDGPGNSLHLLSAQDGRDVLDQDLFPGMNHVRQVRPMFVNDDLWLLRGGAAANGTREPTRVSKLNIQTGKWEATYPAGLAHCFPPVATPRYVLSGVMEFTDLVSGVMDANCITKAACGRDAGWVPAHGLVYVTPKHCVCWPMLRGYAAMAPARKGGNPARTAVTDLEFEHQQVATAPANDRAPEATDWPSYRHDPWRSGSTSGQGPATPEIAWQTSLAPSTQVTGPILDDWNEDPFSKGPITAPVMADGRVVVARPHAHQVVALNADTGKVDWRFTAAGRVDTAPTLYQGLCLFGSRAGWVYCLNASDGQLVWKLRAAPLDERIVTYGQIESPWPVAGSPLVFDDVAYFAAGRQSFADGGILVFAVDSKTGKRIWVQRLDTIPQSGYYTSSGLEFDNYDLLFRQDDEVAMSRWKFDARSGAKSADLWSAFARINMGHGSAMVPQGCWSYAPRNQSRTKTYSPRRPLVVFRDRTLIGCREDKRAVYRRDFDLEGGEKFETKWITGWAGSTASQKGGVAWRSQRLAEKAAWRVDVFDAKTNVQDIHAMALAGERIYVVGSKGDLRVLSTSDGSEVSQMKVPQPAWDGLAVAGGKLFLTTNDQRVLCLK